MAKSATKSNKHFWAKVSIALGFVALFACGMAVGFSINRSGYSMKRGPMTEVECAELEKKIMFMDQGHAQRRLSVLYNRQCWKKYGKHDADRNNIKIERKKEFPAPYADVKQNKEPSAVRHCEAVEIALRARLGGKADKPTYELYDAYAYLSRAEIYANLANRGCPENSEKYRDLALKDIEVAKALNDENFNDTEIVEVVETYKKLNMKAEAEKVLDKAKQLTDPAIDFILQIEKIINE
ncbi:MAG: hypothetical protein LBF37_03995 [Rickettsiales bacterium]|nr:hypothetical protein [Rickettsiales bacterium]